jgi:hypothetical protein
MVPYFGDRLISQVIGVTAPSTDTALVTQKTVFNIAQRGVALREIISRRLCMKYLWDTG